MKRSFFSWWRDPYAASVSLEVHREIVNMLKDEQERYRRIALFLAELASLESKFYKGMKANDVIRKVDTMFTENLGRRFDERHRH